MYILKKVSQAYGHDIPVILNCQISDNAHYQDKNNEFKQLWNSGVNLQSAMYSGFQSQGVSVLILLTVQLCLLYYFLQHVFSNEQGEVGQ